MSPGPLVAKVRMETEIVSKSYSLINCTINLNSHSKNMTIGFLGEN